jgi:hypothetical protein
MLSNILPKFTMVTRRRASARPPDPNLLSNSHHHLAPEQQSRAADADPHLCVRQEADPSPALPLPLPPLLPTLLPTLVRKVDKIILAIGAQGQEVAGAVVGVRAAVRIWQGGLGCRPLACGAKKMDG